MTTIHHSHQRTPSAGHKFVLRPTGSRSVITKNYSSGKLSSASASKTNIYSASKSKSADPEDLADDFDMAMSFHQYCTTCEKQIAVPNNAVLYCSESCRRRDGSLVFAPPSPPLLSEYEAFTKRPALSRRKLTHALSVPAVPAVQHEGAADMDPTEWKPDGSRALLGGGDGGAVSSGSGTAEPPRRPSEAFLYLSKFHKSTDSLISSSSRRSKKSANKAGCGGGTAAANLPAGKGGFYLTPAGSNESSAAGSPMESVSIATTGTAPSFSSSESDLEHDEEDDGMAFSKKKLGAREEIGGSLGLLLATSRDGVQKRV